MQHHADSSLVPAFIKTKTELWEHIILQLASLLDGQRDWVTNLANTSSLVYHSLLSYPAFGNGPSSVNWCGFYINTSLFPTPKIRMDHSAPSDASSRLLLGPFCGKPACQFIDITPGKGRGVCADAFMSRRIIVVPDVEAYPGHIACDGDTRSEIVCPLILGSSGKEVTLGVFDLDCLAKGGFDDDDRRG
ncbi:GAF domain-like protein [Multifurca ochricompacta]|uniref:GAF domain-like protein n=1 Tax=Multifurca ochricompacta TaxID=376703 RepID=A0AAD4M7V2_9AGAM|nr:GAF domain-like protein [Multifurca ochricompacta]